MTQGFGGVAPVPPAGRRSAPRQNAGRREVYQKLALLAQDRLGGRDWSSTEETINAWGGPKVSGGAARPQRKRAPRTPA